ncbi:hypothetical protein QBC34DRAFT_399745 [Podospora aff. communis PSN243]|uniref:BZIP domain-containing protein n=1 Tax=Podospora aff. communis PSN243 TaxID=3040156 RepID=A0AAV9GVU8_9PEZI|nr:hypothetical protein QBC34DRAFT_399745 [Podospora aff. communis PSN243]
MFAVLPSPAPSFGFDAFSSPPPPPQMYRPAMPSPLSSSPIRASSVLPPPRSTGESTFNLRDAQSSPLAARSQQDSRFKYATRNAKPNPVVRKREDAQEGRRRLFLQNVRQRQEDQKWEKRGGEEQLLKLEWSRLNRELLQAKESDIEGFVRIEDIENEIPVEQPEDIDMMLDALEQEEQAELEALLASLPSEGSEQTQTSGSRPDSMHFSDDEDYDSLFMELISEQENVLPTNSDDVEMS